MKQTEWTDYPKWMEYRIYPGCYISTWYKHSAPFEPSDLGRKCLANEALRIEKRLLNLKQYARKK